MAAQKAKTFWTVKNVSWLILLALAVIVVIQNNDTAHTQILFWTISMPRVVLLAIMLGIGWLAGWMTGRRKRSS